MTSRRLFSDLKVRMQCLVAALRHLGLFGASAVGSLPMKDIVLACSPAAFAFLAFAFEHGMALWIEGWIARHRIRRVMRHRRVLRGIDAL